MWKYLLTALVMFAPISSRAETYLKVYANGSWALFRVDGLGVSVKNGPVRSVDGMCMAAFVSPQASLKLAMAPPRATAANPSLKDFVWVQIAAQDWDFRSHRGSVSVEVKVSSYTERSAQYDGHAITFGVPDAKQTFGMFLMFAGSGKNIDVIDSRGKTIARFPANGFAAVRDRLYKCAGA